jgi:hypothetical protein
MCKMAIPWRSTCNDIYYALFFSAQPGALSEIVLLLILAVLLSVISIRVPGR